MPARHTTGSLGSTVTVSQPTQHKETQSCIEKTEHLLAFCTANKHVNAIITPTPDIARAQAEYSDLRLKRGIARPLEGIPITVKDNFCTNGIRTTAGSKILHNYIPQYESTVTQRLWKAGAVLIGKTNMDEFGMGSTTTSSYFGPTINPVAERLGYKDIVPGGSSGGSAAAVAGGMCLAALGTDTGGSIRQPASFCGIVGMKPTYGLCSRWGIIAYASSLDQAGVLAQTPEDVALILNEISAHDPKDSTSYSGTYPNYGELLKTNLSGKTIGIPRQFFENYSTEETQIVWAKLKQVSKKSGLELKTVSLPNINHALQAYYVIALSEASSNLARYDGVKYGFRAENPSSIDDMYERTRAEGFGDEVKRRIMLGTFCLSAGHYDQYFQKACKVRRLISEDFSRALEQVDVLAWPTTPSSAFSSKEHKSDPTSMYLQDVFTVPINLAGLPAISIPIAKCNRGLPLGLTLCSNLYKDALVLGVSDWLMENLDADK